MLPVQFARGRGQERSRQHKTYAFAGIGDEVERACQVDDSDVEMAQSAGLAGVPQTAATLAADMDEKMIQVIAQSPGIGSRIANGIAFSVQNQRQAEVVNGERGEKTVLPPMKRSRHPEQ